MMCHWENIATVAKTGHGQVTIGGFVTHLARNLGVTGFHNLILSGGPASFNLDRIKQAKFVDKVGDTYFWIIGLNRLPMPLKKPSVDITRHSTFLYYHMKDEDEGEGDTSGDGDDHMEDEAEPQTEEVAHMPPMRDGADIGEGSGRAGGDDEADIGRERRRRKRGEDISAAGSATLEDPFGGHTDVDLRTIYDMIVGMRVTTMQMSDRQRSMEVRQIAMQEQLMAIQAQLDQMSQRLGAMYNWWEQQHGGGGGSSGDPPSDPGFYF